MKSASYPMIVCQECARRGVERPAVALCPGCAIGLCARHLAEEEARGGGLPRFGCHHEADAAHRHALPFAAAPSVESFAR
jgi:hypothetical protein